MRVQCKQCPWRVGTDPNQIPRGYDEDKHRNLARTIATPGEWKPQRQLRIMACHDSDVGDELPCVGWLHHQLGVGNNIALRLAVHAGRIDGKYLVVGEQHETFEATLPAASRGT